MATKKRTFVRWGVVDRATGQVLVVRNMERYSPDVDGSKHIAIPLGGDPRRPIPEDIRAGSILSGDNYPCRAA